MHTLSSYTNLKKITDLKDWVKSKKFGRYILLYLYDGRIPWEKSYESTKNLFTLYGREINNELGSDYIFLTVYEKEVFDSWAEFAGTEMLREQFTDEVAYPTSEEDRNNNFGLLLDLADFYGFDVSSSPALVIIDADRGANESELVAKIQFTETDTAEEIYKKIKSVIKAIKDFYGDFKRIADACNSSICISIPLEEKLKERPCFYNIITGYRKRASYTQEKLADKLGIDEKTLGRYEREEVHIPRETAIAIAILLRLTLEETDNLLNSAKYILDEYDARDRFIRECIQSKFTLTQVNQELIKKGYDPIG